MFCDDCIEAMLDTVENQAVGELVIYDTEKNIFYPVEDESKVRIGDYALEIGYKNSGYKIDVKSVNETE